MEITGDPARPTGLRRALFRAPIWLYRFQLGPLLGKRAHLLHGSVKAPTHGHVRRARKRTM